MASTTGNHSNSTCGSTSSKRNRHSGNLRKEKERSRKISDGEDSSGSPKRSGRTRAGSSSSPEREDFERRSWECTVCTYRNPSEAFRCEMCDVRKGTSTRKPRLNSTVVEQQQTVQKFVQQQQAAMMAQANREKRATNEKGASASNMNGGANGSTSSMNFVSSPPETPSSTLSATSSAGGGGGGTTGISHSGCCSPSRSVSPSCSKTPPLLLPAVRASGHFTPSPLPLPHSSSFSPCAGNQNNSLLQNAATCSLSPSPSPSPSSSQSRRLLGGAVMSAASPQKQLSKKCSINQGASTSFNRKLRRAILPTATSKLSADNTLISSVDQNSARTLAVTVNGITVVITDYKLRPNEIGVDAGVDDDNPGCSSTAACASEADADEDKKKPQSDVSESRKRQSNAKGKSKKKRKSRSPSNGVETTTRTIVSDDADKGATTAQSLANHDVSSSPVPNLDNEDQHDSERQGAKKTTSKVKLKSTNSAKSRTGNVKSAKSKRKTPTPMEQSNGQEVPSPSSR